MTGFCGEHLPTQDRKPPMGRSDRVFLTSTLQPSVQPKLPSGPSQAGPGFKSRQPDYQGTLHMTVFLATTLVVHLTPSIEPLGEYRPPPCPALS
jgi:hypothetical protein